ncbi:MAG TPA: methylenetetrahydrofolate reductase [Dehalococcoidia bacterium]|nr:methylenetetrahydrofolate reductase [Dehalococcoidia bacterium]
MTSSAAQPAVASAAARLRAAFASSRFVITAELDSPSDASPAHLERQARAFAAYVDAVNCTDNSAAKVRMCPVAAAALVARAGLVPLVQLTCRDRNRIALQSDALGAAAVGAAGIVCMTGDPPGVGNHPEAKAVLDVSSTELMAAVRGLCQGHFISGDPIARPPDLLVGSVENPADGERSLPRLRAKIEAGAEFVQTQITVDAGAFAGWVELLRGAGLTERVRILAGVAVLRRPAMAHYLNDHVPGVTVPERVMQRLEGAEDPAAAGVEIAAELVRELRAIPGVDGVHLMSFGWNDGVRRVVDAI